MRTEPIGFSRRRFFGSAFAAAAAALAPGWARRAAARPQSIEPYIGEIMLVPYAFAPRFWAFCNGQLLPIAQNQALFSLLGTTYGGNGVSTFALPNLQGRVAIHEGQGPGLSYRNLGEQGGEQAHTLALGALPAHTHTARAGSAGASSAGPTAALVPAQNPSLIPEWGTVANATMGAGAITSVGGSQAHPNLQPYSILNYVIALQGIYPPRP